MATFYDHFDVVKAGDVPPPRWDGEVGRADAQTLTRMVERGETAPAIPPYTAGSTSGGGRIWTASPSALGELTIARVIGELTDSGEESAMVETTAGRRALPRLWPPVIGQVELIGRPTLNSYVETLYGVPQILANGIDWFRDLGQPNHPGIRSWLVSGRVTPASSKHLRGRRRTN